MLIWLLACSAGPVGGAGPARADDRVGAPIDEWLANSSWDCLGVASSGATRFEIAHSWSFTDTLYTTDLPTVVASEANSGEIPFAAAYQFMGWVSNDGSRWSDQSIDTSDRHWFGVGETGVLLEMTVPASADGSSYAFTFTRYAGTDGTDRLRIDSGNALQAAIIDCGRTS